jgi:regulation of enolase protein 1 (concanavalin A-like superfamily)
MNESNWKSWFKPLLWTGLVIWAMPVSARAAQIANNIGAASQLYLVIRNTVHAFSLTAFNTLPTYTYRVETNADISNPRGWGLWIAVTATDSVTPLSSLSSGYKEIFFRAIVLSPSDTGGTNTLYLGHTENESNTEGDTPLSDLQGWGHIVNPDKDATILVGGDVLALIVPGGSHAHDLAADIHLTNAPRVVQSVTGDFTIQVRTDGRFDPGDISTQPGRHAYNGAALIVMADPDDVVTLARAGLQYPQKRPAFYANFEIRADGRLRRIGLSGDSRLPAAGPVFLRLQKKGTEIFGSVSLDGIRWRSLGAKQIPVSWPQTLSAGVATISTSEAEFAPRFSQLRMTKDSAVKQASDQQ